MKKVTIFTLILALAVFFIAMPAQASKKEMWAAVYKWDGKMSTDGNRVLTRLESGVTFTVFAKGTLTKETLYYPQSRANTSLKNPVTSTMFAAATICNKRVAFGVDPTDTTDDRYVDLIVTNLDGGFSTFVYDFDQYQHTIVIDQSPGRVSIGAFPFIVHDPNYLNEGGVNNLAIGALNTEWTSGVVFRKGTQIRDVFINVDTANASGTLNVGTLLAQTGGVRGGFIGSASLTTAGRVADTAVAGASTNGFYINTSVYGSHIATHGSGLAAANLGAGLAGGTMGAIVKRPYYVAHTAAANARTLTYSAVNATALGSGVIFWEMFYAK